MQIVNAAGWPIWFLIFASVIAVALILERLRTLRAVLVTPGGALPLAQRFIDEGIFDNAALQGLARQGCLGNVLAAGVAVAPQGVEKMRVAMDDALHFESFALNRYLPALGTIAGVAPLLGLFGTVIGMIETFGAQTPSGMNPAQLAHGISIALYNTAMGIFVAIVALLAYRILRSKVDAFLLLTEHASSRLMSHAAQKRGGL